MRISSRQPDHTFDTIIVCSGPVSSDHTFKQHLIATFSIMAPVVKMLLYIPDVKHLKHPWPIISQGCFYRTGIAQCNDTDNRLLIYIKPGHLHVSDLNYDCSGIA